MLPIVSSSLTLVNALGQISLSNLPFGTYQWEELISPKGYKKIEGRHSFTVDGITKMISIPNERLRGQVILTKYDRDDINVCQAVISPWKIGNFQSSIWSCNCCRNRSILRIASILANTRSLRENQKAQIQLPQEDRHLYHPDHIWLKSPAREASRWEWKSFL